MPKKPSPSQDPYGDKMVLLKDAKSRKVAKLLIEAGPDVEGDALSKQNHDIAEKSNVSPNKVQAVRRILLGNSPIIGRKPEPDSPLEPLGPDGPGDGEEDEPPEEEEMVNGVKVHDIDKKATPRSPTPKEGKKVRLESALFDLTSRVSETEGQILGVRTEIGAVKNELGGKLDGLAEMLHGLGNGGGAPIIPAAPPAPGEGNGNARVTPGEMGAEVEGFYEKVAVPSSMRTLFAFWKAKQHKQHQRDPNRYDEFEGGMPEFFLMTAKLYFKQVGANLTYVEEEEPVTVR